MLKWISPVLFALLLGGSWVAAFLGGAAGIFGWILITAAWPFLALLALLVALIVIVVKRRFRADDALTLALCLIAAWPLAWSFGAPGVAYPANAERTSPAAEIRPLADGPLHVVWGGDTAKTNRHALTPGQRWAYDLVIEPAMTGAEELSAYGCFGAPVFAPISAKVHLAHDGEPDLAIGEILADPAKLLGNHVILELESGTYLVIAHLQKGSVLVSPGDNVNEGDPIGACGNSGNTSEPHIHIHHQRQDPMLFDGDLNLGVNYVEGLPLYFRDHEGPAMPKGGIKVVNGAIVLTGDVIEAR